MYVEFDVTVVGNPWYWDLNEIVIFEDFWEKVGSCCKGGMIQHRRQHSRNHGFYHQTESM